jgi:hypothetical protein
VGENEEDGSVNHPAGPEAETLTPACKSIELKHNDRPSLCLNFVLAVDNFQDTSGEAVKSVQRCSSG